MPAPDAPITRRSFVLSGAGTAAAYGLGGPLLRHRARGLSTLRRSAEPHPSQYEALRALGRQTMRVPESLPHATVAAGTDTIPQIEHVVVLMMENHSYDNFFGMLGRGKGQTPRGDGFTLARDGMPNASNPTATGAPQRAFHMPTTCQLSGKPSQDWQASHVQYDSGSNNGFVISDSGPVAMGYWDATDLPYTYDLASRFPIGDRWFCSLLGQTDPNRRYLLAATSMGMTNDIPSPSQDAALALSPPHGTILDQLSSHNITWAEFAVQYPQVTGLTEELYPTADEGLGPSHAHPIADFFSATAGGTLPSVSLVDPNFSTQSQENPQNIVVGEAFLASVVNAIGASPKWQQTLLIITYDEHGGYYDHVPPPAALAPDNVAPILTGKEQPYDGFRRYGFRVPAVVVGPYAKTDYVSSVVYDHASILAFIEHKWNLPALTYRDANANNLLDFLNLPALAAGQPTFPEFPQLAAPGDNATTLVCSTSGPGTIPPPASTTPPASATVTARSLGLVKQGLKIKVAAAEGTASDVQIGLRRGKRVIATAKLKSLPAGHSRTLVLAPKHGARLKGTYVLTVTVGGSTVLTRTLRLR